MTKSDAKSEKQVKKRSNAMEARQYFVFRMLVIRGACIIAVIALHISPYDDRILQFCVPVFVLLSGFSLSLSRKNELATRFYRRTLKFLLAPYLIYSMIFAVIRAIGGVAPDQLWHYFLSSNLRQHLWFMPMIIGLYLLHPWLRRLYRRGPIAVLLLAFFVQLWFWPWATERWLPPGAAKTMLSFMGKVGFFAAGYFVSDHVVSARQFCESRIGMAVSAVFWVLWPCLDILPASVNVPAPLERIIMVTSHLAAFFILARLSSPASNAGRLVAAWVGRFGLYSFGVYLLHPAVGSVVRRVIVKLTGMNPETPAFYVIVFVVMAPVTLYAIRWVAKLPGGRYVS